MTMTSGDVDTARGVGEPSLMMSPPVAVVDIAYFTDPLCSWSWAFEPQWRRLRYEFGDQIAWRYHMGGMLADWQSFSDPLNAVANPAQMGLHWHQVRELTAMPFDERVWWEDPPDSSYPSCLAVKAAELQGADCAERYLRKLREAVMLERRNVARQEVLLALAAEQAGGTASLDATRFARDLQGPEALAAFQDDVKTAHYRGIGRFPAIILRRNGGRAVIIVGYRPYDVLCEALGAIAPELKPVRSSCDAVAYAQHWGSVTAREVAEVLGITTEAAARQLDAAVADGRLGCDEAATPANRRYVAVRSR